VLVNATDPEVCKRVMVGFGVGVGKLMITSSVELPVIVVVKETDPEICDLVIVER
jgi:hypothetical protein